MFATTFLGPVAYSQYQYQLGMQNFVYPVRQQVVTVCQQVPVKCQSSAKSVEVKSVDYYQGLLSSFVDKYLGGIKEGLQGKKKSEQERMKNLFEEESKDHRQKTGRGLDFEPFGEDLSKLNEKIDHLISSRIMTESRDEINKHVKEWAEKVVDAGNKKELTDVKLKDLINEFNEKIKEYEYKLIGEMNQELSDFMKSLHWLNGIAKLVLERDEDQGESQVTFKYDEACPFSHGCRLDNFISPFPQETDDVVKFDDVKNKILPAQEQITTTITTWVSCCEQRIRTCHWTGGSAKRVQIPGQFVNRGYWGVPSWSTSVGDSLGLTWGAY